MFLQLLWEEGVREWAPDLKGFLEDWHEIAKFFRLTRVHDLRSKRFSYTLFGNSRDKIIHCELFGSPFFFLLLS